MMKSKILPAAVTAVAGFALGWAVKPASHPVATDSSTQAANADAGSSLNANLPDRTDRPPLVLPKRNSERPDGATKGTALSAIRKTTSEMVQSAEQARVQRLSEALGMNSEQEGQLAALSKKLHVGFKDLSKNGKTPAQLLEEAALAQAEYDDGVKNLLDPGQQKALEAFKDRKKDNEIESGAQTVLTDIGTNTDLSPEQRQAVLEKLRENSKKYYEARPAGYELMSENFSVMGTSFATSIDDVGAAFLDPNGSTDPADLQERLQSQQQATASNRIALLKGILTPAQLSQYESTLASRLNISRSFKVPSSKQ